MKTHENQSRLIPTFRIIRGPVQYVRENAGILIGLFGICAILSISSPVFLTSDNILNIFRQVFTNAILAFGMTFAIIIRGIDLSVGSIMAATSVVTTGLIVFNDVPIALAVLVGLLLGLFLGFFNGIVIAKTGIAPFIVTLAMYSMARGFAYIIADGKPIRVMDPNFNIIGSGFIGPISFPVIYCVVLFILLNTLLGSTKFGRHVYAIGGNSEAARFSGIKIARVETVVYTLIGVLSAVSGIVLSARMYTGQPSIGQGSELDAIAAVVLGGTSFTGGTGSLGGTVVGVLIIGVLNNGMNILNVSSFYQLILKGFVILLAVFVDQLKKGKRA